MNDWTVTPDELDKRIGEVLPEIIELRRRLHRNPERKFQERMTSGLLREKLKLLSVDLYPPFLETDVVGLMKGKGSGRNITLRADMDALPIIEETGREWASLSEGTAHSCGHDGHMAMLYGALKVLSGYADRFRGSIRFVFQPAEEESAGGLRLIEKGLFEKGPPPDAAFALHAWPGYPEGLLSSAGGTAMAAADRFVIRILGMSGHGAMPHSTVDPVLTGAQLVQALQSVVSRNIESLQPAVLSVGAFHAGEADNVIPSRAEMKGTVRYFDRAVGDLIRERMERIIRGVCEAAGAEHEFDYIEGYIPLVNDPSTTAWAGDAARAYLGNDAWREDLDPSMGAEDFAYYLEKVPGALVRIGMGEESPPLHHPAFDFNDRVIKRGIGFFCAAALRFLSR